VSKLAEPSWPTPAMNDCCVWSFLRMGYQTMWLTMAVNAEHRCQTCGARYRLRVPAPNKRPVWMRIHEPLMDEDDA
jgi:hypothetical protein